MTSDWRIEFLAPDLVSRDHLLDAHRAATMSDIELGAVLVEMFKETRQEYVDRSARLQRS
jgi:hypothetical protein